jgi:hypothetical protein
LEKDVFPQPNCLFLNKTRIILIETPFKVHCMKKTLTLIALLLSFGWANAQKVYSVDYASQADVKVYVVDYESQADLKVYRVNYASQAKGNDGKWFSTDYASQADKKIYFVDYESQADLKIYFVDYESQAGWRKAAKKMLMY